MSKKISVTLKNDLSEIERLSKLIEDFGEINNLSPKIIFDVNLTLDELITNIISYGYEDEDEHKIIVTIWLNGNQLKLKIVDDGLPFNPLTIQEPDHLTQTLDDRPMGGLGIYLVRKLMDHLEYKREQNKNMLLLTKLIDKKIVK
ncbi:MAG: ATP-binding protein [Candidatus Cloacimonetes bacterium]|nr:ATP-binding protein [Candidatus Cloacimonadota bacterium]